MMLISTPSQPLTQSTFRAATGKDCFDIAKLFQIASDGVSDYIWHTLKPEYPGLTPLEIGAIRYANVDSVFNYKNVVLAERNGSVAGMMLTFPIVQSEDNNEDSEQAIAEESNEPDVMAPYALEAPDTWYICALAVFPEFRNQGIGSQFIQLAHQQAAQRGFQELSLLCFAQNEGALRLYQRQGFQERDRTPVVPHPLIHYTGDILLMTTSVQT